MRRREIYVVLITVCFGAAVSAQAPSYDAEVRARVAEVRGGQSTIYPVTSRLFAGTRVRVKKEESGWLGIAPPQGSTSWVMERFLDQQPSVGRATICTVVADESAAVPVLLGAPDQPGPLAHQVSTVKRGTMVVVLGERATSDALGDRTTWWRIQPTANEVRWLAKEALQAAPAYATAPQPALARSYGKPMPELWTLAEQAERSGNSSLAAVYFRQLAAQQSIPGGDYNLAAQASARADQLSRRIATTTSRGGSAAPNSSPATGDTNGPWTPGLMYSSGPGYLRRVAFQIDNQTTYALEDDRGFPRLYVVAQPGLSLEPLVNRRVDLFGPMVNRPDMTVRGFMSVKTVHLLR